MKLLSSLSEDDKIADMLDPNSQCIPCLYARGSSQHTTPAPFISASRMHVYTRVVHLRHIYVHFISRLCLDMNCMSTEETPNTMHIHIVGNMV